MKNLTKCAVAAALAASFGVASAAPSVTLYGRIDTGFAYTHTMDAPKGSSSDQFEMTSGMYSGSRWGLKGSEMIGSTKIGFQLESGFASDAGTSGQGGRLFGREARLYLSGAWGEFGAGRMGSPLSTCGSVSKYWDFDPFEGAFTDAGLQGTQAFTWNRHDNSLYYVSPKFAGFEAGAFYSLAGLSKQETTGLAADDHYGAVYIRWDGSEAKAILGAESYYVGHAKEATTKPNRNQYSVKAAATWTPGKGPFTLYAGANWFKNYSQFSDGIYDTPAFDDSGRGMEGIAGFIGATYDVGATSCKASFQYLDGKNKGAETGADGDYKRYVAAVGAHYRFSKRTSVYGNLSYAKGTGALDDGETTTNRVILSTGLVHKF